MVNKVWKLQLKINIKNFVFKLSEERRNVFGGHRKWKVSAEDHFEFK